MSSILTEIAVLISDQSALANAFHICLRFRVFMHFFLPFLFNIGGSYDPNPSIVQHLFGPFCACRASNFQRICWCCFDPKALILTHFESQLWSLISLLFKFS